MKRSLKSALLLVATTVLCLLPVAVLADSQVRIVRLSDVQGSVKIDRATGQGFEKAFLNMPITQGVKLKTGDDGRAEVEFEDGTVAHVAPNSSLEFTDLGLLDSGAKISTVDVEDGEAYFNFKGDKQDEFTVTFGHEKTTLARGAHIRVDLQDNNSTLAVFSGDVQVDGPSGEVKLSKKQSVTFDQDNNDQYKIAKNIDPDPFDQWDKQQSEYHDRYQASNSYNSPYGYGASDLNYYGSYMMIPGYGLAWQPYFTGMGWNPYMDGAWMMYPGLGYSWVSAYPWGWTPYHYGSWAFVPQYGWMWIPGNTLLGWNRVPPVVSPPRNYVPPRPPSVNSPAIVAVGRGPATSSMLPGSHPGSHVALNRPTAGLGIPRGVQNLAKANQQFQSRGEVRVAVPGGARGAAMSGMPTGSRMGAQSSMGAGRMGRAESVGHMSTSSHSSGHSVSTSPHK